MKLIAINGRAWSKAGLQDALRASQDAQQNIDLLVVNAKFFKTFSIAYHDGLKNPHLARSEAGDLLDSILKPLTE